MAKDIVIHVWCDRHMETDERVEARELPPITLDGKIRTLDLCDPCIKEFVTPLAQLLEAHGALPSASASRSTSSARVSARGRRGSAEMVAVRCLWCSKEYSADTGSGYMAHAKQIHGYASAIEAFGTTCPICGDLDLRMMMTHVKRVHPEFGFTHTAQAIHWANIHGDPHGVYAATLSRKPSLDPKQE